MTTTYKTLVNDVLRDLNEVEVGTVSSARGVQNVVKKAVNNAVRDIVNSNLEWSFNHQDTTQVLTPGVADYNIASDARSVDWGSFILVPTEKITNSNFDSGITSWTDISAGSGSIAHDSTNNRMTITGDGSNAGAAEQSISTIVGKDYTLYLGNFVGNCTVNIGTSSGGTEITTTTFTVENNGLVDYNKITFTPTTTTTYIGFANTSTTGIQIDSVRCARNIYPRTLSYMSLDEYRQNYKHEAKDTDEPYTIPTHVVQQLDDQFTVYPDPNDDLTVEYEYWATFTEMSVDADTVIIPDEYIYVVESAALMYVYMFRSDYDAADRYKAQYLMGLARMKKELITRRDYLWASRNYTQPRRHKQYSIYI